MSVVNKGRLLDSEEGDDSVESGVRVGNFRGGERDASRRDGGCGRRVKKVGECVERRACAAMRASHSTK